MGVLDDTLKDMGKNADKEIAKMTEKTNQEVAENKAKEKEQGTLEAEE